MKLYINPVSNNARKVVATAKHLGLDVEYEVVDLSKGAHKQPEFLALNPNGMIPVLTDGNTTLWESNAIMAYLASKKDNSLWPKTNARYDIMKWMSWQLAHFGPTTDTFGWENMLKGMMGKGDPDAANLAEAAKKFERFGAVLNGALEGNDFLVGNTLTLADFAVGSCLSFATPAKIPVDQFNHVKLWMARLDELPAWRETAPKM